MRGSSLHTSVDHYAQNLKQLFCWAYTSVQRESHEAESMAQSVLAYQFVAGLQHDIKLKLAGCEGTFEQLLTRVQFEEARLRDIVKEGRSSSNPQTSPARVVSQDPQKPSKQQPLRLDIKCFSCGGMGHHK